MSLGRDFSKIMQIWPVWLFFAGEPATMEYIALSYGFGDGVSSLTANQCSLIYVGMDITGPQREKGYVCRGKSVLRPPPLKVKAIPSPFWCRLTELNNYGEQRLPSLSKISIGP